MNVRFRRTTRVTAGHGEPTQDAVYGWSPALGFLALATTRFAGFGDVADVLASVGAPRRWFLVTRWDEAHLVELGPQTELLLSRSGRETARAERVPAPTFPEVVLHHDRAIVAAARDTYHALTLDRPPHESPGPVSVAARTVDGVATFSVTLVPPRGGRGPRLHTQFGTAANLRAGVLYPYTVHAGDVATLGQGGIVVVGIKIADRGTDDELALLLGGASYSPTTDGSVRSTRWPWWSTNSSR